jgi:hypothetical protein
MLATGQVVHGLAGAGGCRVGLAIDFSLVASNPGRRSFERRLRTLQPSRAAGKRLLCAQDLLRRLLMERSGSLVQSAGTVVQPVFTHVQLRFTLVRVPFAYVGDLFAFVSDLVASVGDPIALVCGEIPPDDRVFMRVQRAHPMFVGTARLSASVNTHDSTICPAAPDVTTTT